MWTCYYLGQRFWNGWNSTGFPVMFIIHDLCIPREIPKNNWLRYGRSTIDYIYVYRDWSGSSSEHSRHTTWYIFYREIKRVNQYNLLLKLKFMYREWGINFSSRENCKLLDQKCLLFVLAKSTLIEERV